MVRDEMGGSMSGWDCGLMYVNEGRKKVPCGAETISDALPRHELLLRLWQGLLRSISRAFTMLASREMAP